MLNALLLRPLPFAQADRLVMLYEKRVKQGRERNPVSSPDFIDWRQQNRVFLGMDAFLGWVFNFTSGEEPERLLGAITSAGLFETLGVKPIVGRTFLPEEEQAGKNNVVVISNGLWQRCFGSDPAVAGKSIRLNDRNFTVIGVLPPQFQFVSKDFDVWAPMDVLRFDRNRGSHSLNIVARLKPGVTIDQARAEMTAIAQHLEEQYPEKNLGHSANVFPLRDEMVPAEVRPAIRVMLAAVAFVLLIACANVANLLLARARRAKRRLLSAGRWAPVGRGSCGSCSPRACCFLCWAGLAVCCCRFGGFTSWCGLYPPLFP